MTPPSLSFVEEMEARGFLNQTTDRAALSQALDQGPLTVYAGFDATASSFHVGNLMILMLLMRFQRAGHRVIVLMGGGTTLIGDPSDKKSARPLLDPADIQLNIDNLSRILNRLFPGDLGRVEVLNNADWLGHLSYLPFLRDVGRHFSVNRMVGFDFVKTRLQAHQPLSFLELNYMVLQAYDFLHLFQDKGCRLQVGGADQWANIISGVELIRRTTGQEAWGWTCPLLVNAQGQKMGKTVKGAVWLWEEMLSPYDFWQFWRNTDDRDVLRLLRLLTFLPLTQIDALSLVDAAAINSAKKLLADEVTTLVHGPEVLPEIHAAAAAFFAKGPAASPTSSLKRFHLNPAHGEGAEGMTLLDLLVRTELVVSRSEGRRLIRSGAVRWNGVPLGDESAVLGSEMFADGGEPIVSVGQKKHLQLVRDA